MNTAAKTFVNDGDIWSYEKIQKAVGKRPFESQYSGDHAKVITKAVNQGIDSHLEGCYTPDRGDKYEFPNAWLHCRISAKSMPVLLRRLSEDGSDAAQEVFSNILCKLGFDKLIDEELENGLQHDLSDFEHGYVSCALWTENIDSSDANFDYRSLSKEYGIANIDTDTLRSMLDDCKSFLDQAGDLIEECDMEQAGHDFWLTRNGHGAGFWDGDWDTEDEKGECIGQRLAEISKSFGEDYLYVGDDDWIYGG